MEKVTPIYKSGDAGDPNNYRPISVLPLISKEMERAIQSQLACGISLQKTIPCLTGRYVNQDSGRNIPPKLLLYTLLITS